VGTENASRRKLVGLEQVEATVIAEAVPYARGNKKRPRTDRHTAMLAASRSM